jgi:hypothetical protein
MPGFLIVFGYPNAFIPGGYGLDVRLLLVVSGLGGCEGLANIGSCAL